MKIKKQNNQCVWIGIGINVSSKDSEYDSLINLNTHLTKEYANTLILNSSTNQPHVNLYDLDVPEDNLKEIESTLERIVNSSNYFKTNINNVSFFKHGTIFLRCELNSELIELERAVVEEVSKYKGNCKTEEYWQPWREYSLEQIENREKYGNPHVLNTFHPHITVGFVKTNEKELKEICEQLNKKLLKILIF